MLSLKKHSFSIENIIVINSCLWSGAEQVAEHTNWGESPRSHCHGSREITNYLDILCCFSERPERLESGGRNITQEHKSRTPNKAGWGSPQLLPLQTNVTSKNCSLYKIHFPIRTKRALRHDIIGETSFITFLQNYNVRNINKLRRSTRATQ